MEQEIHIVSGKVVEDHVHIFVSYKSQLVLRWQTLEIFDDRCLSVVRRCLRRTNAISFIDKFFER